MSRKLFMVFGFLLIFGGYLYYQSESLTTTQDEPAEFVESYKPETAPVLAPKGPSERALSASIDIFSLLSEEEEQAYLDKFSGNGDIEEAVTNLATLLDSDSGKLSEAENLIITSQLSQPSNYEYTGPSNDSTDYYGGYENNDYSYPHDYGDEIDVYGGSSSYTRVGDTIFGSDGDSYTQVGDTTFSGDGTSYTQVGDTVFGSDGSSATQVGNTTFINW